MKNHATKRVLALVLALAMLVPCFLETAHTAHADTITATPAVYDLYDLSGTTSITVNGTGNGNWDPIVIGNIDAADKENVSFKANVKITEDKGYRFSLGAPENVNCQNANGYGFELNYEGGWLAFIRGSDQQWVAGWGKDNYDLNQLKGEYELEFGYHDIIEDGNVVGKRIFLKKNGEVLFTADDKGPYMTGDAFGTKVALFHYGTAVEMESTYETSYGSVKTYDVYDLTGTTSLTINGTGNHNWEGTVIGDIDAAHKENVSFKANVKITDGGEHRFSLGAKESSAYTDPNTYGFVLHFNMNRLVFLRNNGWIDSLEINNDDFKGEYELEFGYRDITFGGNVIGKQLFVKKNGELVYTYDDMNGYLTGDALGTKVALFHYGSVDTFNTTYSNSYGSANVYDIYDLTGASAKSVDPWNPTKLGDISAADKEQAALQFKFNITNAKHRYRFAVGNTADGNGWDPKGYAVEIAVACDGANHVKFTRGGSQIAKFDDISALLGEHVYEFGYRNITMGSNVLGKQVYLSVDGVDLYTYDDNSGYLTGDSLGTWVTLNHIDDGVAQLNSTYSSGFGTVNVYDVADLTGTTSFTINGTGNHNWEGTVIGDIDAAHKENVSFKANVKITDGGEHRFSLGAKESSAYTDPNTYGLVLHFDMSRLVFIRNGNWINSLEINNDDFKGEYELEFGYRDITLGKYVLGKQLFVKKNGELVYTYDDMSGYLTGDALGTKVALFHYGTVVEMNTTKECAHNYSSETTNPDCVNAGKTVYTCTRCGDTYEESIPALGHSYESVVTAPTATKEGYTTHTCANCGDSYTDSIVPAIGIGELKISGSSVTLYNNLKVNFSVKSNLFIEDAYTNPYMVFTFGKKTMTVTDYTVADDKYIFSCDGISPSQIGDQISVELHAELNGQQYVASYTYSVAQYCYDKLAESTDAKLNTLLVDLLNYGAAAQVYSSYNNGSLCNAGLTDEQKAFATQEAPSVSSVLNTKYATIENAAAKWKGATLQLGNAINLRVRFAAESIEGLTVKFEIGGVAYYVSQFEEDAANPGTYVATFDQIKGRELREDIFATVYQGETAISNTVRYSVESYAAAKWNDSNAKLAALVQAMMKYGDAAVAYLG